MNTSRRFIVTLAVFATATIIAGPFALAQSGGGAALPTRSNDGGGVRVVVKPTSFAAGAAWEFEVVMDTHTKPLDDDMTKAATLVDDGGRKYAPLTWQGDKPGGHHRKGVLRFPAPTEPVKSFELQIQGLGGDSKNNRVFQWTRK